MVTPLLLLNTHIIFHIYVNWVVFCNFSKNGRSNGTCTCCAKFVISSSYILSWPENQGILFFIFLKHCK